MTTITRFCTAVAVVLSLNLFAQPADYQNTELAKATYVAARGVDLATPDQLFQNANQLKLVGNYDQAIDLYSQTLLMNPNHAEARFNRAYLLYETGHFAQAKAEFDEYLHQNVSDAEALEMRGMANYQNNQLQAAIEDFNQAFSLTQNTNLLLHRGMAFTQAGMYTEAMQDLDQLIELDAQNAAALAARGDVMLALQRYQPALHWYDRALNINENDAVTLCNRGTTHTQLGNFNEAINDFEKALQIEPTSQMFLNLAYCYFEMGELFLTKKMSILAMQYNPDNLESYYLIGLTELENEEPELAVGSFEIALEEDPNNLNFLIAQAEAFLMMDDFYSAIENANIMLDNNRNSVEGIKLLQRSFNALETYNLELLKAEPTALEPTLIEEDVFYEDPYGH